MLSLQENNAIALLMQRDQSLNIDSADISEECHPDTSFKLNWGQFNTLHQVEGGLNIDFA